MKLNMEKIRSKKPRMTKTIIKCVQCEKPAVYAVTAIQPEAKAKTFCNKHYLIFKKVVTA